MKLVTEAILWIAMCAMFLVAAWWAAELGSGWSVPFIAAAAIDGYFAIKTVIEIIQGDAK